MKYYELLIIEDNFADIRLIEEVLKTSEYPINIVSIMDGEEALIYLKNSLTSDDITSPDLILLDLNIPAINGFEILKHIKDDENLRRIPTIMLTSSESEKDVRKSYNLHANAYVVKPFHLDTFLAVIKSISDFWMDHAKLSE